MTDQIAMGPTATADARAFASVGLDAFPILCLDGAVRQPDELTAPVPPVVNFPFDGPDPAEGGHRVHNFTVASTHTYVAGGIRVHNTSEQWIDLAGSLGQAFGSQLGTLLTQDESQFIQLAAGTALGTITRNIAEVITDIGFHGTRADFNILGELEDIHVDFASAALGTVSSFLIAELGEALGLEGFGAELFNISASAYTGSVLNQALTNLNAGNELLHGVNFADAFANAVPGALGGFLGSQLANQILPPDSIQGQIGGSLGSIAGVSLASSAWFASTALGTMVGNALGALGNFIIPGVGAFFGTLIGTFIGNLFGDEPDPEASMNVWFGVRAAGNNIADIGFFGDWLVTDGFPEEPASDLVHAVTATAAEFMDLIGTLGFNDKPSEYTSPSDQFDPNQIVQLQQHMRIDVVDGQYQYFVNDVQVDDAGTMVDRTVTNIVLNSQPIGGDLLMKRALANSNATDMTTVAGHLSVAQEYERYLENADVINALIAADPSSAFAMGWVITLAQAQELGLGEAHEADFHGGLIGFRQSLVEAGLGVSEADISVGRDDATGEVFIDVRVGDAVIPGALTVFANDALEVEVDGERVLRFAFDDAMSDVGYTLSSGTQTQNVIIVDEEYYLVFEGDRQTVGTTMGRDLWFADQHQISEFFGTGFFVMQDGYETVLRSDDILIGDDRSNYINAHVGDDWVDGGAGDDHIDGFTGNDVIFGGDGDDVLFGNQGNDYLEGGAGADIIGGLGDYGDFIDRAGYARSDAAVYINLTTGEASGGHAEGDTLQNIDGIVGSQFDDTLVGDERFNILEGGAGADILDGGGIATGSHDFASYQRAGEGLTASLADTSVNTGDAEGDQFINITGLEGSAFDDLLIGDHRNNSIIGGAGDDVIIVGVGADYANGSFGFDILSYREHTAGVVIDLANWAAGSLVVRDDTFGLIEAFEGTSHDDTLRGDGEANILLGADGADRLEGRDGDDLLSGGDGRDTLIGGRGDDVLDADGNDTGGWQVLRGGNGSDTYMISSDAGAVSIDSLAERVNGPIPNTGLSSENNAGIDTISFTDLTLADLDVSIIDQPTGTPSGNVLRLSWDADDDRAGGRAHIAHEGDRIERFQFADGTTLSRIDIAANGRAWLHGTDGNDLIVGGVNSPGDGNGHLTDDNVLVGHGGNDTLIAGKSDWRGDIHMNGGADDDTYVVSSTSGVVTVHDVVQMNGTTGNNGHDVVRFNDLTLADLHLVDHPTHMRLAWGTWGADDGGVLQVSYSGDHIEGFEFADGTWVSDITTDHHGRVWLHGTSGDDLIVGGLTNQDAADERFGDETIVMAGAGDDTLRLETGDIRDFSILRGQTGDDTYEIGSGAGSVVLDHVSENAASGTDLLRFTDLNLSDLRMSIVDLADGHAWGNALRFQWSATDDRPAGQLWVAHEGDHIEGFEFADGTRVSVDRSGTTPRFIVEGTFGANDMHVAGFATALGATVAISGGAGDDALTGTDGDDLLIGEIGADTLFGGAGIDLFAYQTADDSTVDARDTIRDFVQGVDRIDLSAIDANVGTDDDDAFVYISAEAFSGTAGELRFAAGTIASDIDGDGEADIVIDVQNVGTLTADDFVL